MAINIFSGSGSGNNKNPKVGNSSRTDRAKKAISMLSPSAEASKSGSTAVESKGTLAKIGNVVGKVAGVAGKFLPGIGGTIASAISNLLNDPEWWQQVKGDALTLNEPLRLVNEVTDALGNVPVGTSLTSLRTALLEVTVAQGSSSGYVSTGDVFRSQGKKGIVWNYLGAGARGVMTPSERMITQYLMPQIRKVVNAIPLQDAMDYREALEANATLYAAWRQLKKFDYMTKHGQTYLANMNDPAFPLLRTQNAAWLQATINRLEEYLRANVRLPHTLCEYLAWRFGRVYKSNDSVKSALVLYDVIPISCGPNVWDTVIAIQMNRISKYPTVQRANTDLFNTYFDHDYIVEIRDDTQFKFDKKEFMLRLNLAGATMSFIGGSSYTIRDVMVTPAPTQSLVCIDSALDNPTAFMASTVSTTGLEQDGAYETLFPVDPVMAIYIPSPQVSLTADLTNPDGWGILTYKKSGETTTIGSYIFAAPHAFNEVSYNAAAPGSPPALTQAYAEDSIWWQGIIDNDAKSYGGSASDLTLAKSLGFFAANIISAKAVDVYMTHTAFPLVAAKNGTAVGTTDDWNNYGDAQAIYMDATALSMDAGSPTFTVMNTEHVYAFANLVDIERKHSMSYKQAEHLVARDTADLIDTLDVAAVKS